MANYPAYNYMQPMYPQVSQPQPAWQQTTPPVDRNVTPMQPYQPMPYQPVIPAVPQQPQPQTSLPTVRGRIISREEEITPNEVAMDGQVSLFPLADYSCIVAKLWDSNGQMQTFKFVPMIEQSVEQEVENKSDMILGRLDDIENLLKRNRSRQNYKKNQNGSRNEDKEVDDA